MFPCRPPFSYSGIGEVIAHRAFDFVPERFLKCAVTIVNKHSFTVSGISGEKRGKSKFIGRVKIVEGPHAAQKKHCKFAAFLRGLNQFAPLRRQNIDSRTTALLVL